MLWHLATHSFASQQRVPQEQADFLRSGTRDFQFHMPAKRSSLYASSEPFSRSTDFIRVRSGQNFTVEPCCTSKTSATFYDSRNLHVRAFGDTRNPFSKRLTRRNECSADLPIARRCTFAWQQNDGIERPRLRERVCTGLAKSCLAHCNSPNHEDCWNGTRCSHFV